MEHLEQEEKCIECNGKGEVTRGNTEILCPECGGAGVILKFDHEASKSINEKEISF